MRRHRLEQRERILGTTVDKRQMRRRHPCVGSIMMGEREGQKHEESVWYTHNATHNATHDATHAHTHTLTERERERDLALRSTKLSKHTMQSVILGLMRYPIDVMNFLPTMNMSTYALHDKV